MLLLRRAWQLAMHLIAVLTRLQPIILPSSSVVFVPPRRGSALTLYVISCFFLPINNDVSPFLSFHQQCYLSSSDCNKEKLCLKIQKNINYYD